MRRTLRAKIAYYIRLNSIGMKRERIKIENLTLRIQQLQKIQDEDKSKDLIEELCWLKAELDLYYDNLYTYEYNGKFYENFIW